MISVIVPIYNVERYLQKCLDSIANQTYADFEVILVNDGSTDRSAEIAETYLRDNRFKLINKSNGGQGQARNVGLEKAKGEYVCFIDSDDFIAPEYLGKLYELLINNKADIAQCGVSRVWDNNDKSHAYNYTGLNNAVYTDIKKYIEESSFVMCNKLYRIELFKGLRFPEGIKFEDFALAPQIYERASIIVSTKELLYNYLWRSDSTTTAKKIQPDILKAQDILEKSEFGKHNQDMLQKFYLRQVVCSLLWEMFADKQYINQACKIIENGIKRYPHLRDNVKDSKVSKVKLLWAKILLNNHYKLAKVYARTYSWLYAIIRTISK